MDNAQNLAWASMFNYQKIIDQDAASVTIPASIVSPTIIATIPTRVANPKQFRVRVEYNGKRGPLSRADYIGTGSILYAYSSGSNIVIECESSGGSPVNVTIRYKVYVDG